MQMESKLLKELWKIPTASLSDALDSIGVRGFMDYRIKPRTVESKVVGQAITVKDKISNKKATPIKALEAIEAAEKGWVLVRVIEDANIEDASNIALFGGIMASAAKAKGLGGAVLDGGLRDVSECKSLGFPVFSRSAVPTNSVGRTEVVDVNVPIICGGVLVNPGDIIVGDADGVVVIPKEKLEEVVHRALKIEDVEKRMAADLGKGASVLETVKKYSRM
ncbi:MAG: RraA family protein [Candidatus Bathyarchaeia archaeon]